MEDGDEELVVGLLDSEVDVVRDLDIDALDVEEPGAALALAVAGGGVGDGADDNVDVDTLLGEDELENAVELGRPDRRGLVLVIKRLLEVGSGGLEGTRA